MDKFWICLFLLSVAVVNAQQGDDSYPQEWGDYLDEYDYESLLASEEKKLNDKQQIDSQLPLEDKHSKEEFDQIEDNRSAQNQDEIVDQLNDNIDGNEDEDLDPVNSDEGKLDSEETLKFDGNIEENYEKQEVEAESQEKTQNEIQENKLESEEKQPNNDDSVYMDEETFSEEEQQNVNADDTLKDTHDEPAEKDNEAKSNEVDNVETNEQFAQEAAQDILDSSKGNPIEEDNVDKIYQDLNDNLDKLMETWHKLNDENNDYIESEKNADDAINPDQIAEYEKKYGVPYGEKYVLSLRDQNYDDANIDEKASDEIDEDINDTDAENKENEQLEQQSFINNSKDVNISDENKNDEDDLFKDDPDADDATSEEDDSTEDDDEIAEENAAIPENNESNMDDDDETNHEPIVPKSMLRVNINDDVSIEKKSTPTVHQVEKLISASDETVATTKATIDLSTLNTQQYDQLMEEFVIAHADEINIAKSDMKENVAPIHMTLTQEPLVVTSPNYPAPYPTNNIVDWMFTGEGIGIELIITDFFVNGVSGDYLLVKPGGIDASGQDGLVFSHMLNEQRRYRFLDVDKMFVRFEARPGIAFRPGFRFTVRMVSPLPKEDEDIETLPEPEAIAPPVETFAVLIGGPSLPQFNESIEDFRLLIADMATLYINTNDIDPGLNTTRQVTQITNVVACNRNWPNSERCSEVFFGVPLVYADDGEDRRPRLEQRELRAMWYLYSTQDPFASRLRSMGMEEFTSPNDSGVLTVWLLVSFGVLVSVVVLAFALWRFSCFENYARMSTYSDRDSVYSQKQGLDLYPTPHQTLPPLFAENEYKWDDAKFEDSTRVDMGGFTNKSYNGDELFDIDSDEDVIPPKHDRYTTDV